MRKFLLQSILFLTLFALLSLVKPLYLLYTGDYKNKVVGKEIYISLLKSKQKSTKKKALLGDSVANQLYPNKTENDSMVSLACNQAISMVGHYLLLKNYFVAGNRPDTIYFMYQPFSFRNNLDQPYTFHYFIKPFYTDEYMAEMDDLVKKSVAEIPYASFAHWPWIQAGDGAPDYPPINDDTTNFISPISADYLAKMIALAERNHAKLLLVPTPLSEGRRAKVNRLEVSDISKYHFETFFDHYFEGLFYLPDSLFLDGIHLKNPKDAFRKNG